MLTDRVWQEIDLFFMQQGSVFETLKQLDERFEQLGISYAVLGGMALVLHGYRRLTEDVDLLLTDAGLSQFQEHLEGRGYVKAFAGAKKTFRDTNTGVRVEIITTGEFPGDGKPKPISFPDPSQVNVKIDGISVVDLKTLIELKLASGLSASDRLKDLADVQELIRTLNLPSELELNDSVRSEYMRLWLSVEEARQRNLER
ncbi:nucleotidyltransferase family protein [Merismopedia glauca]|uniref:Nucleotidyl transferase AbiEii/AbiGii toxin family protein n=1 Tax=Merismopedia glauca CCAP 1448/3 TaxID=1296344 RepID=A0A2T1BXF3_9CYAN|nr:nucleotidyltransferase family protein [Merismopedia glauca]PSB00690.1 hypothetical protein C7B64_22185 [Merismopedia glauca CCAP 1448/3]